MAVNIGILDCDFSRYSNRKIWEAAKRVGKPTRIRLDKICLSGDGSGKKGLAVLHNEHTQDIDVVLARFSNHSYRFGMFAARHFVAEGISVINSPRTIELCQNKYYTALALQKKKIPQPAFALALSSKDMQKHAHKLGFPLVIKLLYGTEGIGTFLVKSATDLRDWMEALDEMHQIVFIQKYIPGTEDYRLVVMGDRVPYGYKRAHATNDWKTNMHYHPKMKKLKVTPQLRTFALRVARAVRADICAVDFVLHKGKPYVLEVNQAPDFAKVHDDIATSIVKHCKRVCR